MIQLITRLQAMLATRQDNERGATMVEYGLMLALIAIVCLIAVTAIGTNANVVFTNIANALAGV